MAGLNTAGLIGLLTTPSTVQPFCSEPSETLSSDLHDRLLDLLVQARTRGLNRCVAVDLTRPDIGVPVVRVLVPGAAGPYGNSSRRPPLRLLRALV